MVTFEDSADKIIWWIWFVSKSFSLKLFHNLLPYIYRL